MRLLALLVLTATLFSLPAFAQTPPPQPTPPPGWHAPDDDPSPRTSDVTPDPDLRATEVLPDEMLRRPRSPRPFGRPQISPTLAVAIGIRGVKNHDELATSSIDLWLGARFHPFVAAASPFVAFGAEVNFRELPQVEPVLPEQETVTYTEITPEMRWGFAHLRTPHDDYLNVVFPNVELYGITGWRLANEYQGHALRVGIGLSVPAITVLSAMCEVPIPGMVEVTMDADSAYSGNREYAIRFGWHF